MVFGGRSSPLNPVRSLFKMTFSLCGAPGALESGGQDAPKLCMEEMMCTGSPPPPRWRHSATLTRHRGEGKQEVLWDPFALHSFFFFSLPVCSFFFLFLFFHSICSFALCFSHIFASPSLCQSFIPSLLFRYTLNPCHISAGREFVFVFGGKNQSGAVLGDGYFLSVDQQHWTEVCLLLQF